jgi:hypothetical protein
MRGTRTDVNWVIGPDWHTVIWDKPAGYIRTLDTVENRRSGLPRRLYRF